MTHVNHADVATLPLCARGVALVNEDGSDPIDKGCATPSSLSRRDASQRQHDKGQQDARPRDERMVHEHSGGMGLQFMSCSLLHNWSLADLACFW